MSTRVLSVPVPSYGYGRPRIVPSPVCLSRVKRCLFGLSSPGEALQQAAAELQRQTEADSRKYNFDFVRDKPLDGTFKWELVTEPHSSEETNQQHPASPNQRLRQSQITEFLQPRKRTSSGALASINNKRLRMQSTTPQARRT